MRFFNTQGFVVVERCIERGNGSFQNFVEDFEQIIKLRKLCNRRTKCRWQKRIGSWSITYISRVVLSENNLAICYPFHHQKPLYECEKLHPKRVLIIPNWSFLFMPSTCLETARNHMKLWNPRWQKLRLAWTKFKANLSSPCQRTIGATRNVRPMVWLSQVFMLYLFSRSDDCSGTRLLLLDIYLPPSSENCVVGRLFSVENEWDDRHPQVNSSHLNRIMKLNVSLSKNLLLMNSRSLSFRTALAILWLTKDEAIKVEENISLLTLYISNRIRLILCFRHLNWSVQDTSQERTSSFTR